MRKMIALRCEMEYRLLLGELAVLVSLWEEDFSAVPALLYHHLQAALVVEQASSTIWWGKNVAPINLPDTLGVNVVEIRGVEKIGVNEQK